MPAAPTLLRPASSDQDKRLHRRPKALEDVSVLQQTLSQNAPVAKHTGIYKLHLQAQATLGTGCVREAVKLPPHVDRATWIAAKMLSIYKDAELMTCLLRGADVCSVSSCPMMCAGPCVQYSWSDEAHPKPVMLSAPEYMERLMTYAFDIISDPEIFPVDMTPSFPEDFEQLCAKLCKRIFRIYAHTYLSHFDVIRENGAEAHLNCCFKHYLFFVKEFGLVEPRDMVPLQDLVEKFEATPGSALVDAEAAAGADAAKAEQAQQGSFAAEHGVGPQRPSDRGPSSAQATPGSDGAFSEREARPSQSPPGSAPAGARASAGAEAAKAEQAQQAAAPAEPDAHAAAAPRRSAEQPVGRRQLAAACGLGCGGRGVAASASEPGRRQSGDARGSGQRMDTE